MLSIQLDKLLIWHKTSIFFLNSNQNANENEQNTIIVFFYTLYILFYIFFFPYVHAYEFNMVNEHPRVVSSCDVTDRWSNLWLYRGKIEERVNNIRLTAL